MSRTFRRVNASWHEKKFHIMDRKPTGEYRIVKAYRCCNLDDLLTGYCDIIKYTVPVREWVVPNGKKLAKKLARFHSDKSVSYNPSKYSKTMSNRKKRRAEKRTLHMLNMATVHETIFPLWRKDIW